SYRVATMSTDFGLVSTAHVESFGEGRERCQVVTDNSAPRSYYYLRLSVLRRYGEYWVSPQRECPWTALHSTHPRHLIPPPVSAARRLVRVRVRPARAPTVRSARPWH